MIEVQNETLTALVQEIDRLRAEICPDKFKHTHEFLQLATVAAQREGAVSDADEMFELAHSAITH